MRSINTRVASYVALIFLLCTLASVAPAKKVDVRSLLDGIDDLYRGEASVGRLTMEVVTEHWSRTLSLDFRSKGTDRSLIRIRSPKKEKGTTTLRVGKEVWNYLPKIDRIIKVPGTMMGSAWMGSHFTNDDLVQQSRMADDYDFELTFEGERQGDRIFEITCMPREDVAVVWGKLLVELSQKDFLPRRITYFDEDLVASRIMTFGKVKLVDGKKVPTEMRLVPADSPNEQTTVTYDELSFNQGVRDSDFTLRSLRK